MRTARFAHGYDWNVLTGSAIMLIEEMASRGYRLVDSTAPEHKKETEGFMSGLVATLYFDNDPAATSLSEDVSVVFVEGVDLFLLNKSVAEMLRLRSQQGNRLISVGHPSLVEKPAGGKMMMVSMTFENIAKPSPRLEPRYGV